MDRPQKPEDVELFYQYSHLAGREELLSRMRQTVDYIKVLLTDKEQSDGLLKRWESAMQEDLADAHQCGDNLSMVVCGNTLALLRAVLAKKEPGTFPRRKVEGKRGDD